VDEVAARALLAGAAARPPAASRAPLRWRSAARCTGVPTFRLYGENAAAAPPGAAEMLHVEALATRSRLHRWEIGPHVHPGLQQVIWLARGSADAALDERRATARAPAAIVVPPGTVHAFRFAPGSDGCVMTISARTLIEGEPPALGEALRQLFERPALLTFEPAAADAARLQPLFDAVLAESGAADAAAGPVPRWLARAALWRLAQVARQRTAGAAARPRRALFIRFVALVELHHLEHWPVGRYAAALGVGTAHLNRVVRAESGLGALALVHQRVVREACRRLIYVEVPVSRLADELGFADAAYFCRFFKRHTGCSPGAYRARLGDGAAGTESTPV
jgi:AraC family transcriptional activator of pobA